MTSLTSNLQPASVCCDPSSLSAQDRAAHFTASVELLLQQRRSVIETEDGLQFHFDRAPGRLVMLAQWIERESTCCPWIEFILVRAANSELCLKLVARTPEAKQMLIAGLEALAALAAGAPHPSELTAPTRPLVANDFHKIAASRSQACESKADVESDGRTVKSLCRTTKDVR